MQTIALIIVLQVVVTLLTGCTEFETKMDMMKSEQLTCSAEEESLCAGWKV
jgi:hypothetical protein